jgi:hypothetical protein
MFCCILFECIRCFAWKTEGKRLLGKTREDNIRMDLREMRWLCVDWPTFFVFPSHIKNPKE